MKPKASEAQWRERVEAWRASGESATQFAANHGLTASTLRWWSSRLERTASARFVRLVPRTPPAAATSAFVVEIAGARVTVTPGFDPALLAQLVSALRASGTP